MKEVTRLFARSCRSSESRVVRCKFRVFQRDHISQSESSREYRFRGLRQDLEGFLSAERKGSAGCSFRSRERTRRKENFSAWRKITFTAQRVNLIFRVAETILKKRDDFADIADDFMWQWSQI